MLLAAGRRAAAGVILARRRPRVVLSGLPGARRPAVEQRPEGRRRGRREGDQVRAAAVGKGQVEEMGVIDRVETPAGQESQVAAIGGENGLGVDEPPVGDVQHDLARPPRHPQPAQWRLAPDVTRPARPNQLTRPAR